MDAQTFYSNIDSLKQIVHQASRDANQLKKDAESSKATVDLIREFCEASVKLSKNLGYTSEIASILSRVAPDNDQIRSIKDSSELLGESSRAIYENVKAAKRHIIPLISSLGDKQDTRPGIITKGDPKSQVGLLHILGSICYVLSLLHRCLNAQSRELEKMDKRTRSGVRIDGKLNELNDEVIQIEEQFSSILVQIFNKIQGLLKQTFGPVIQLSNILESASQLTKKIITDINPVVDRHEQLLEKLRPLDEGVQRVFFETSSKAISIIENAGFTKSQVADLEQKLSITSVQLSKSIAPIIEVEVKQLNHSLPGDHIIDSIATDIRGLETKLKKAVGDYLPQCENNRALLENLLSNPVEQ